MKTVLSLVTGIFGSLGLLFLAPFAYLTGFHSQSVLYALMGVLLMGLSRWLGLSRLGLEIAAVVCILLLGLVYLLNMAHVQALPKDAGFRYRGILTLTDAVNSTNAGELEGWALVTHLQKLVSGKMSRDMHNPWDSPEAAFIRGGGQDFQKTLVLKILYQRLGIPARLVFAKIAFDDLNPLSQQKVPLLGHIWIRVDMKGESRDVCPPPYQNPSGGCFFNGQVRGRSLPELAYPLVHLWWVLRGLDFDLSSGEWKPVSHPDLR
jgi:hypothetical protein